jgi:hypothetical protein
MVVQAVAAMLATAGATVAAVATTNQRAGPNLSVRNLIAPNPTSQPAPSGGARVGANLHQRKINFCLQF